MLKSKSVYNQSLISDKDDSNHGKFTLSVLFMSRTRKLPSRSLWSNEVSKKNQELQTFNPKAQWTRDESRITESKLYLDKWGAKTRVAQGR